MPFVNFKSLEQPSKSLLSEAEKKAQRYYLSCINFNDFSSDEIKKAFLGFVNEVGGWPSNEGSNAKSWNFQRLLQTTDNVLRINPFFKWSAAPANFRNSSQYFIQVPINAKLQP